MTPLEPPKSRRRGTRSLRVRGDIAHTFWTLLAPTALGCMLLGFYLLGSEFKNPLAADASVLLTSSIMLTIGFLLLCYLLRSSMAGKHTARAQHHRHKSFDKNALPPGVPSQGPEFTESRAPGRRGYIDATRVRR